jgi:hypothetical protein
MVRADLFSSRDLNSLLLLGGSGNLKILPCFPNGEILIKCPSPFKKEQLK